MKENKIILCCCIALGIGIVIYLIVKSGKISESFDPQDMGGRTFFGFGRPYGYSVFDTDAPQNCYQNDPLQVCRPGYTRSINNLTWRDECCSNATNYGFFWPASMTSILQ